MKKIKAFFHQLKEWWKIPRARSIMILCFYAIFFTLVFLYIDTMRPSSNEPQKDFWTTYETMNNYEYQIVITEEETTYHISGTRFQEREQFRLEETQERYQVEGTTIKGESGSTELNELFSFSLLSLRPNSLGARLKTEQPISEITYQDGTKRQEYSLASFDGMGPITVTAVSLDQQMKELVIRGDLQVTITYQNIGAIQSLQSF